MYIWGSIFIIFVCLFMYIWVYLVRLLMNIYIWVLVLVVVEFWGLSIGIILLSWLYICIIYIFVVSFVLVF